MTHRGRFIIVVLVWALALTGWLSLLGLERSMMGSISCELGDSTSLYGKASWTWDPPGVRCVYLPKDTGLSFRIVEDPPVARLGIAIAFVLWGLTLLVLRPRSTRVPDHPTHLRTPSTTASCSAVAPAHVRQGGPLLRGSRRLSRSP